MEKYIITQDPTEQFDNLGKSLGLSDKMALFYSISIGRKRIYRQEFDKPQKGLKILSYKRRSNAEKVCNHTNDLHGSNYKVEQITS